MQRVASWFLPVFANFGNACALLDEIDAAPPEALYYTVSVDADVYNEGHVLLRYEIVNGDDQPWHFLPWHTPLEGLAADQLEVSRAGEAVPYMGILTGRVAPELGNYRTLAPGERVHREVRLTESYDLTGPGVYTVAHNGMLLDARVGDAVETREPDAFDEVAVVLHGPVPSFTVAEGANLEAPPDADPRYERGRDERTPPPRFTLPIDPMMPTFQNCDPGEEEFATAAFLGAHAFVWSAAQAVSHEQASNAERIRKWYGNINDAQDIALVQKFARIYHDAIEREYTMDCQPPKCDIKEGPGGAIAYVVRNSRQINLCDPFWSRPATGAESAASTIVHEWSHIVWGAGDNAYGQSRSEDLTTDPWMAILNADTAGYFATSVDTCGIPIATLPVGSSCQTETLGGAEWVLQASTRGTPDQQIEMVNLRASECSYVENGVRKILAGAGRVTFGGAKEHVLKEIDRCSVFLMVGAPPSP